MNKSNNYEYKVIDGGSSYLDLQDRVVAYLEYNWFLAGGVAVYRDDAGLHFIQSMMRSIPKNDKS